MENNFDELIIKVSDPENQLVKMIDYIMHTANIGHSFEVVVDPDMSEYTKKFYMDGDGSFYIKEIKKNGKSLIIVDEMFSGTNPKEGEASSYAIAEFMAQLASDKEQIIALMASHYSEMTKLEENTLGVFKNYKVSVNIDKNSHKLDYPFKLQEGKSNQKVAIDILQTEGLDQKIIDSARKIVSINERL